jgi:hypothetical protein
MVPWYWLVVVPSIVAVVFYGFGVWTVFWACDGQPPTGGPTRFTSEGADGWATGPNTQRS